MNEKPHEHASGPTTLAEQLGLLQAALKKAGQTQKAAIQAANKSRRKTARLPENKSSPRAEDGVDLTVQTVNDWFPKRTSVKEPSVPRNFLDLWDVVVVMLQWTGQLTDRSSTVQLKRRWEDLHEAAQSPPRLDEEVRAYLTAARTAAGEHPYPGLPGQRNPPELATVYVRHQPAPAHTGPDEPAETLFQQPGQVCVLIAGPGGGKSTLLRTRLREAANHLLKQNVKPGAAIPIWVSARTLAKDDTSVPKALAAATSRLSRYGLNLALDEPRFRERPHPWAHWQLLVDDLDELPNADQRRAVLEKLAHAVDGAPVLYRCVVATRPLAEDELTALDDALGHKAPRWDLLPFTTDDLHTYIRTYLTAARGPAPGGDLHAQDFIDALDRTGLTELARTPLMAFMLCQLHLADPNRPLPHGRTAVYEAFRERLYANNEHKNVVSSHEGAIDRLVEGLQIPRARAEAAEAARRVQEELPELIDELAHQWLTADDGQQAPATDLGLPRPEKVHPALWHSFVEGLLTHTGLLVHHADGLRFFHQTFLEFHAARHATRTEEACTDLLDELLPLSRGNAPQVPPGETSYLGFVLDRLLAPTSNVRIETLCRLRKLRGEQAYYFFANQVRMRTNLPTSLVAEQFTRTAWDETLSFVRLRAARDLLTEVDGYRDRGIELLAELAADTHLDRSTRVSAAETLGETAERREEAARLLVAFAKDVSPESDPEDDEFNRINAAEILAGWNECEGCAAGLLVYLARDTTLSGHSRIEAAVMLTEVDGHRDRGADLLAELADDTHLGESGPDDRGLDENGLDVFGFDEFGLDGSGRAASDCIDAAEHLSEIAGHEKKGTDRLISLASDRDIRGSHRVQAARTLAQVDEWKEKAAELLDKIARATACSGYARIDAAEALAGIPGQQERAAELLADLAADATLSDFLLTRPIKTLAGMDRGGTKAAGLLDDLSCDEGRSGFSRIDAAEALAGIPGQQERAAELLADLAADTHLSDSDEDDLDEDDSTESGLHADDCIKAAKALARIPGHAGEGTDRLTALAANPDIRGSHRERAELVITALNSERSEGLAQGSLNEHT